MRNLDLREEAVVAARPEEVVDGVVGSVDGVVEAGGGAANGRTAAGDVGEAVTHWNWRTLKLNIEYPNPVPIVLSTFESCQLLTLFFFSFSVFSWTLR